MMLNKDLTVRPSTICVVYKTETGHSIECITHEGRPLDRLYYTCDRVTFSSGHSEYLRLYVNDVTVRYTTFFWSLKVKGEGVCFCISYEVSASPSIKKAKKAKAQVLGISAT